MTDRSNDDGDEEGTGAGLRRFLEGLSEEAQDFTRRRPVEGLLLSFIAGMIVSDLLRRNR